MDRLTTEERAKAVAVIMDEATPPIAPDRARRYLSQLEGMAIRMHRLNERMCNEDLGELGERLWSTLAKEIRACAADIGLGVYINGDPRGNPVGILTPKTGRFNTMGGREDGWRL